MKHVAACCLLSSLVCAVPAFAQDAPAPTADQRSRLTIETLVHEREGAIGEARLCGMDTGELRRKLADAQKEIAELKAKAAPPAAAAPPAPEISAPFTPPPAPPSE